MKLDYAILSLCADLEVSPSGYYDWQKRRAVPGPRAVEDQTLAKQIEVIHVRSRQTYGSPRIVDALRQQGCRHGRNRIARLMKERGLCGRQQARYRVRTTDSNHDQPIAPNRLAEAPKATAPNQLWVADITYIQTQEGWLYLAAILDLYSRKIVGWAMSERIDTKDIFHQSNHLGKCIEQCCRAEVRSVWFDFFEGAGEFSFVFRLSSSVGSRNGSSYQSCPAISPP